MNQHVHYDLAAAEKLIRSGFEDMNAAPQPEAMTDRDREFVRVQIDLQEAQVQFALWHLRRINDYAEIDVIVRAAGHAVGTMLWSLANNSDYEPVDVIQEILSTAAETIGALIHGGGPAVRTCQTTVRSETGGNA